LSGHVWKRNEIESPCIKLCVIDENYKLCIGCYRTAAEITKWSKLTSEKRKEIMEGLEKRGEAILPKRRRGKFGRIRL